MIWTGTFSLDVFLHSVFVQLHMCRHLMYLWNLIGMYVETHEDVPMH